MDVGGVRVFTFADVNLEDNATAFQCVIGGQMTQQVAYLFVFGMFVCTHLTQMSLHCFILI